MINRKPIRAVAVGVSAMLMTVAPGLNMAAQRNLKPDGTDLGGYLYQLIGRTFEAMTTDQLTAIFMFFAALWFARRYLFHKPKATGAGEYLLAGFFSVMMLLSASIRAAGSVQTLYENAFQAFKTVLYLCGMFPIFLCALRGLNELLHRKPRESNAGIWERHPFAFPVILIALAWLPQIIIKYPGVLVIDSCLQFREYLNLTPRSTTHPPFGTLLYGLMVTLAMKIGSYNLVYFLFILLQTACFIAVLGYSLWLMHRLRVPFWVRLMTLILYAVSPCYAGWSVVIVKDSSYLILCLLAGVMILDFVTGMEAFLASKGRLALLAACLYLMILTRHNGLYIALPTLAAVLLLMLRRHFGGKKIMAFALYSCVVIGLAFGTNEVIIRALNIQRMVLYDYLSIPFQQTARVVWLHEEEIPEAEMEAIDPMLDRTLIRQRYTPNSVDPVKWTRTTERNDTVRDAYLRVWWQQMKRYPMDYVDALLNMNVVMFDLQSNFPVYISLTDNSLTSDVYRYSFNDMNFYDSEEIRPLNSLQRALTEWYFRFSDIPVVGQFASMGFCTDLMLAMLYLTWADGRRRSLMVWIPSLVTAVMGLFCPIVYSRYLLPAMCSLPLWFAAYYATDRVSGARREWLNIAAAASPDGAGTPGIQG